MGLPGDTVIKNLPANAGDTGESLDQEDPLKKEMETHSSILAWGIQWTEEPGGFAKSRSPGGRKESDTTEQTHTHICPIYSIPIYYI